MVRIHSIMILVKNIQRMTGTTNLYQGPSRHIKDNATLYLGLLSYMQKNLAQMLILPMPHVIALSCIKTKTTFFPKTG